MADPRVLSIQSHVVFGYVGNKSAAFPLQILGFEVDAINSVQFSNHTGYKKFGGQVLTETDLRELIECLKANELDNYTHLLTGYVGAVSFLKEIGELVKYLKSVNPELVYVCDPVMGDNGKMYVPPELLPVYRDTIIYLADILTPNQFELELLTDIKIIDHKSTWEAIDKLHEKGCQTIVVSSSDLGGENTLIAFASTKLNGKCKKVTMEIPRLSAQFTGTGDLFASLFLAWMYKTNKDLKTSLENTVSTIQAVLKKTYQHAQGIGLSVKNLELKLIQSKREIEKPKADISAKVLD